MNGLVPPLDRFVVISSEYIEHEPRLFQLLNDACAELRGRKGDISLFSHYESYDQFANHIQQQIILLQRHRAEMNGAFKAALVELYEIFLPTSDWDDIGGSLPLANEILTFLKMILG